MAKGKNRSYYCRISGHIRLARCGSTSDLHFFWLNRLQRRTVSSGFVSQCAQNAKLTKTYSLKGIADEHDEEWNLQAFEMYYWFPATVSSEKVPEAVTIRMPRRDPGSPFLMVLRLLNNSLW